MQTINNKEFGQFLNELRKEKGLTQKQLAEQLFLSDKAVSKWERGLSFPDISLLIPLSKILEVTTTELLSGKRIESNTQFTIDEVDSLVSRSIVLSKDEAILQRREKLNRITIFSLSMIVITLELIFYIAKGYSLVTIDSNFLTVELLMFIFGLYFTFFAKETLPTYYDENKISYYSHGAFRMNMIGLTFNNSNWRHIVKTIHISMMSVFTLLPVLYLFIISINPLLWEKFRILIAPFPIIFMFIPMYIVGKKYE
ncbi:MAG: helix-turn-helix domain-containing protein [Cellulosilyticaceae bacterium]